MITLSVAGSLLDFSESLDAGFFSTLRSALFGGSGTGVNGLWGSWYGICATPIMIMFAIKGIMLAMGHYDGAKLKADRDKFLTSLLILGFGMFVLPIIEDLAKELNTYMKKQVIDVSGSMYKFNSNIVSSYKLTNTTGVLTPEAQKQADETVKKWIDGKDLHEQILISEEANEVAKKQHKILLPYEVNRMNEIAGESGAFAAIAPLPSLGEAATAGDVTQGMESLERTSKINKALASADPRNMEVEDEDRGIFDWNFADIIATIFMVLGALIKVIIMFVRGVLLIVLRFSLPLVVAMSFVPTFEGAIKEWWESYKILALWLIPLTIIELVSTTSWVIAQTATTRDGSSMINACVALVCGILYMLAPQITAMMFGGSPAMAGISQPIMSAGAIMGGLGKASLGTIKRGGKVVSKAHKGAENDKGAEKPEKPVA